MTDEILLKIQEVHAGAKDLPGFDDLNDADAAMVEAAFEAGHNKDAVELMTKAPAGAGETDEEEEEVEAAAAKKRKAAAAKKAPAAKKRAAAK